VDYTPLRISGVGGWLLHGDLGMSIRLWASEKRGVEFCFMAPSGGGRPWAPGRSLHRLIDTCYLDGYFSLGAGIPVGGSIDWQLVASTTTAPLPIVPSDIQTAIVCWLYGPME